jgi:tyrosine-protein phosphatase non-receptor type 11
MEMSAVEIGSVHDVNKWLHQLTPAEVENLLKKRGFSGSFLVRHGRSKPGSYTLTVMRDKDNLVHVKIFNYGDAYSVYDDSGENNFASLVELLFYYWTTGGLSEKNGKSVELLHPVLCGRVDDDWYYDRITAQLAEKLLKSRKASQGSFIVRKRLADENQHVLSIWIDDKVEHVIVDYKKKEYFIQADDVKNRFCTLAELVHFYQHNDIKQTGRAFKLGKPLSLMTVGGQKDMVQEKDEHLKEFHDLQTQDTSMSESRTEGMKPVNKIRNRYKNILPYDRTRVKLQYGNPETDGSDYINANYIQVDGCQVKYIATQGCLTATVADFWRMIWQENTRIIVMVTELVEAGKNKCCQYWPKPDAKEMCQDVYKGRILVQYVDEVNCGDYKIRKFLIGFEVKSDEQFEAKGEKRTVYQYHFTSWPDKSLPKKPDVLVHFTSEVMNRQAEVKNLGPIVVHCSAGIGRTGTFMVIGVLLDQVKRTGTSDKIHEIVRRMRTQRSGMVQTEAQYKFLYDVLPYIQRLLSNQVEYANFPGPNSEAASAIYQNLEKIHIT